jgi:leader peptidase (prepilin peptidase)/N-methyltransferase
MGLFLGSFYNVVGIRLPNKESLMGRSHCTNCDHQIGWLELMPILGYIILGGKCKSCKTRISIKYPLMELLTGILFLVSYVFLKENMVEYILVLVFISLMTIVTVSDLYYQIVPDQILLFFLPFVVVLRVISDAMPWYEGIIGGIVAFLFMYLIALYGKKRFKQDALGGGDIKLYFLIGIFLGYQLVFLSLIFSALAGIIYGALKKQEEKTYIAFVPFIYFGSMIAYYFGSQILDFYNTLF